MLGRRFRGDVRGTVRGLLGQRKSVKRLEPVDSFGGAIGRVVGS